MAAEFLWLDDKRTPPWGYSLWAKTAGDAIGALQRYEIAHCSLDHDLAEEHYKADALRRGTKPPLTIVRHAFQHRTGYAVIEWMIREQRWVPDITVHSLSVGAGEMMDLLRAYAPAHVRFQRVSPSDGLPAHLHVATLASVSPSTSVVPPQAAPPASQSAAPAPRSAVLLPATRTHWKPTP